MRFGGVDNNRVVEDCFNIKYLVTLSKIHLGGGLISKDSTAD
jgi:hypothetical protein